MCLNDENTPDGRAVLCDSALTLEAGVCKEVIVRAQKAVKGSTQECLELARVDHAA